MLEPTDKQACTEDQQQVADDRAGQRGLDDLDRIRPEEGEEGDDQLGGVAEGGVEEPADLRPRE